MKWITREHVKVALVLPAKIVNGADTDNTLRHQPESAGLNAVAEDPKAALKPQGP